MTGLQLLLAMAAVGTLASCSLPSPRAPKPDFGSGLGVIPGGDLMGNAPASKHSSLAQNFPPAQTEFQPSPLIAGSISGVEGAIVTEIPETAKPVVRPTKIPDPEPLARVIAAAPVPPKSGRRAWAIERVRCAPPDQARILMLSGRVQGTGSIGEAISLRPERRYHLNYDQRFEGINKETDICIPPNRYCFKTTSFDSFGGSRFSSRATASFDGGTYASGISDDDLAALIQHAVWTQCAISP